MFYASQANNCLLPFNIFFSRTLLAAEVRRTSRPAPGGRVTVEPQKNFKKCASINHDEPTEAAGIPIPDIFLELSACGL